ncbi:hypothetical protein [Seonamhaeicola aphaedonensis]|uniref:Uncharacterized protein n=1 Tax=Seonamhaeicola aphaedonensis TaxID=1461338 RepID=A0A3D9H927_9FLAO|nr:hypothetical protein [Seonamhaeicola aphaedonensis]RED46010.1 hypothetical protein DFQ02_107158 [Seonamhaeicola aphaedonensis]
MLGLLLIYFIGKRFYDLSIEYDQNKWLYAILSIIVYYAAAFVLGLILGLLDFIFDWGIDWDNNFGWNLLGIPAGLLAVWGFYVILEISGKNQLSLLRTKFKI